MYTEIHYPIQKIPPEKLDQYLADGWFRMGQTIFTCWFLFMESGFYSAIWIRQHLKEFKFKRSSRKLLSRNGKIFRYRIGKVEIDYQKERLYKKHKVRFDNRGYSSLRQSLMGGSTFSIFDTRQIEVFLEDELVAVSFFDVGKNSMASISGIFNPKYQKYSLGFYTMLLEMEYALEKGMEHYYPGYIVPGNPRFDYKTRIGNVEFFQFRTKEWVPLELLDTRSIPSSLLRGKLSSLSFYLSKFNISSQVYYFPPYESSGVDPLLEDLLKHPMYLKCFSAKFRHFDLFATYDLVKQQYQLGIYYNLDDFSDWVIGRQPPPTQGTYTYNIFMLGEIIAEDASAKNIAQATYEFIYG